MPQRVFDKGVSPEVLVTPGLGGWVSMWPYFFFRTSKKYYIFGCIYTLLAFWAQELDKSMPSTMWESANPQSALLEL
jgi:hypothetical protein